MWWERDRGRGGESGSSSRKVSLELLHIPFERTIEQTTAPSPKTITAANKQKTYKFSGAEEESLSF